MPRDNRKSHDKNANVIFFEQVAFFLLHVSYEIIPNFLYFSYRQKMADEDISLNEDQLLDNLDDANGDLLTEVC